MSDNTSPGIVRKTITRSRFLIALDSIEAVRFSDAPSSYESLLTDVLPSFAEIGLPRPFGNAFDFGTLSADYGGSPAWDQLRSWLMTKQLDTEWMVTFAIFSLACHHHRPEHRIWCTPPVHAPSPHLPPRFTVDFEAYDPEYETRDMAAARLRKSVQNAVDAHLHTVDDFFAGQPAPRIASKSERRDLEWVALNQVHRWSPEKIAKAYHVGADSISGHTGRPHVARRLARWKAVLDL